MPRHLAYSAVAVALLSGTVAPSASAQPWKTCAFNDQPIRFRDSHSADGTVLIQGNAVFTNTANGNRIFMPLR